jgi:hypothetical protein
VTLAERSKPSVGWRLLLAAAALFALYVAVAALGDVAAYSGSDAGGKIVTTKVMAERSTDVPDIGYWAAAADPNGEFHPIVNTSHIGDRWVQATSLPFQLAAVPLYRWGGNAGVLLLPMLGGVAAALGAWRLATALGASSETSWVAFALVGVAGPALFYSVDFWEHGPALGLALLGASFLLDCRRWWEAALAGALVGAACVLRAEVFIVSVALVLAVLLVGSARRWWLRHPGWIAAGAAGAVLPVLANLLLERAVLGTGVRGARAGTLASRGGSALGGRVADAVLETGGLFSDGGAGGVITSLALVTVLAVLGACAIGRLKLPSALVRGLLALAVALYLARMLQGPGFVPGFVAVAPLVPVGIIATVGRGSLGGRVRVAVLAALLSLPPIWLLQWQGNHVAQWGGRYVLVPGALLSVAALVALERTRVDRRVVAAFVGACVLVGLYGAVWHVQRTRRVVAAFRALEAVPADVVIASTDLDLLREGASFYGPHRWLTVPDARVVVGAGGLGERLDVGRVDVVEVVDDGAQPAERPPLGSYRVVGTRTIRWLDSQLLVTTYERG